MQNRDSANEGDLHHRVWGEVDEEYEDHNHRLQRGMYQLMHPPFTMQHRMNEERPLATAMRNGISIQHDDSITVPSILHQRIFPTFAQYTFPANTLFRTNNFVPQEQYSRSNLDEYRFRRPLELNLQMFHRDHELHDLLHNNSDFSRLDWQSTGDIVARGQNRQLPHDWQLRGNEMITSQTSENDSLSESLMQSPWSTTSAGLLGGMTSSTAPEQKPKKARKKPKDKPKRPLSAYNIFFKEERQRILEEIPESKPSASSNPRKRKKSPHGKIGFETLAKVIGRRWQDLASDQVERYKQLANEDMQRYKTEMEIYLSKVDKDDGNDDASCKLQLNEVTQLKTDDVDSE
jgi:hypothetical protein